MSALETAALPDHLAVLRDPASPLTAVLRAVGELEAQQPDAPRFRVGLSSNVTVDLLAKHVRRHALLHGTVAEVHQGTLDAHLENVRTFAEAGVEHLLVLDVFDVLAPALEARAGALGAGFLAELAERVGAQLRLVLSEATTRFRSVDVALMHRLGPASAAVDAAVAACNAAIRGAVDEAPGARVFAAPAAIADVGLDHAFDPRFHLRFRAPYTARACDKLARRLVLATRAGDRWRHKALVLDCDGTLWGGILGEDGVDGIRLGPHSYPGNAFWAAQHAYVELQREGVLLCLASKNNPHDVAEALARHPEMVLRPDHVVVQKVSWDDKASSLRAIAAELGIGLDALVFVDDSPFEVEAVREQLPEVATFLVPREPWAYLDVVRQVSELFLAGRAEHADAGKTEQYRVRAAGSAERARHGTLEDYLRSLDLRVDVRVDERLALPRIAELTRKSNQFNLTTIRYGEGELASLMDRDDACVLSLHVADRFGEHGLTGVLVARFEPPVARVEAFLMSCRVLGRGLERAPWAALAQLAAEHGCVELHAEFRPTAKNPQVASLYDALGLTRTEETAMATTYAAPLAELDLSAPDHLAVRVC